VFRQSGSTRPFGKQKPSRIVLPVRPHTVVEDYEFEVETDDFNDFEVGKRHDLPLINIFDAEARLKLKDNEAFLGGLSPSSELEETLALDGTDRFDARKRIVARMEAAATDVVLDEVGRVLALQVVQLAVDDHVLFFVHLLHLQDHDVGGQRDHLPEAVRRTGVATVVRAPGGAGTQIIPG